MRLRHNLTRHHRRFPLAFQFIFIFILFGTVPWLPESPRCVFSPPYFHLFPICSWVLIR